MLGSSVVPDFDETMKSVRLGSERAAVASDRGRLGGVQDLDCGNPGCAPKVRLKT